MESPTFRARLAELMQKSRQALRLYVSMGKIQSGTSAEFAEGQAQEWRRSTLELLQHLGQALEQPSARRLTAEVFSIRDRFLAEFRAAERELNLKQRDLIVSAEHGDFTKAAILSRDLVLLKARTQATQAAHHELQTVIRQSRVSAPEEDLNLAAESVAEEDLAPAQSAAVQGRRAAKSGRAPARVIPLRQR